MLWFELNGVQMVFLSHINGCRWKPPTPLPEEGFPWPCCFHGARRRESRRPVAHLGGVLFTDGKKGCLWGAGGCQRGKTMNGGGNITSPWRVHRSFSTGRGIYGDVIVCISCFPKSATPEAISVQQPPPPLTLTKQTAAPHPRKMRWKLQSLWKSWHPGGGFRKMRSGCEQEVVCISTQRSFSPQNKDPQKFNN